MVENTTIAMRGSDVLVMVDPYCFPFDRPIDLISQSGDPREGKYASSFEAGQVAPWLQGTPFVIGVWRIQTATGNSSIMVDFRPCDRSGRSGVVTQGHMGRLGRNRATLLFSSYSAAAGKLQAIDKLAGRY